MKKVFLTDFDGTMAGDEFYRLVILEILHKKKLPDHWSEYLRGEITHFDLLVRYFSQIHVPEDELVQLLDKMLFHPETPYWVGELEKAGWKVVVVSAGCDWYIKKILKKHKLDLEIYSNYGVYSEKEGLVLSQPVDSPFHDNDVGISKEKITQHFINENDEVVYAGDGKPDFTSILNIKPENRYARGWLAEELTRIKETYIPFKCWNDCARSLLERE